MTLYENIDLLEELCATPGLSGFEDPMIRLVKRELLKHTDDVTVDRLGNVIAIMHADQENAQTLMIEAHIDEIGFLVRYIRPDGFLRIYRVGYPNARIVPSTPVAIHADDGQRHYATIGSKSHHSTPDEERFKVVPIEDLFVDAGFSSAAEVTDAGIRVGSPITYWPNFRLVGDTVMSKTLDNRLLVFAMLNVMEALAGKNLPVNVACVGAVHEEFTSRGGEVATHTVEPDMAVILDVAVAADPPDLAGKDLSDVRFGGGAVITTFAYHPKLPLIGTLANPRLYEQMVSTAQRHGLRYTLNVASRVLTDSWHAQYFADGLPVIDLQVPTRYTHTPIEFATLSDTKAVIDLLKHFVLDMPPAVDLGRG